VAQVLIIGDDSHLDIAEITQLSSLEAQNGVVGVQLARLSSGFDNLRCHDAGIGCYGVLMQLRSDQPRPDYLSDCTRRPPASRYGMELGADDYLTKPFTPSELLGAVSARLSRQSALEREYESRMDELRGSLLRTLPHELRTPLTGILGYAEMLITAGDDLSPAQTVQMASRILRAGQRLFRLIELCCTPRLRSCAPTRHAQAFRNHVVEIRLKSSRKRRRSRREANRADDLMVAVETFGTDFG
jgi:CheY-like chemotaxis protein